MVSCVLDINFCEMYILLNILSNKHMVDGIMLSGCLTVRKSDSGEDNISEISLGHNS